MQQQEALHNPPFRAEMRENASEERWSQKLTNRLEASVSPPTHAGARNNFPCNKIPSWSMLDMYI